jgi:hypothetical protein
MRSMRFPPQFFFFVHKTNRSHLGGRLKQCIPFGYIYDHYLSKRGWCVRGGGGVISATMEKKSCDVQMLSMLYKSAFFHAPNKDRALE